MKDLWREKRAIGKLHNPVVHITCSPLRTAAFNSSQRAETDEIQTFFLPLQRNTGTGWNSMYKMIARALRLDQIIKRYCEDWELPKGKDSYDLSKDFLDTEDWEELRHHEELIKPFWKVTIHTEGRAVNGSHGALWEVLPAFDYLFKKLQVRANETVAIPHLSTTHYSHCLNVAFLKLSEYFTETDKTLYYRAAVALHPFFRYAYFEETWINQDNGVDEIRRAKEANQLLYEQYVAQAPPLASEPPSTFYPIDGNDDDEDYELFFNF